MKHFILTIATALFTFYGFSQETEPTGITITVTVDNVKNDTGKAIFALHNEKTFLSQQGLQNEKVTIENNVATVTFKNVAPGTYAILVLHDENENGDMDFESDGRPIESYGMSNNPMSYGPPSYSDAKFEVSNENLKIPIRF